VIGGSIDGLLPDASGAVRVRWSGDRVDEITRLGPARDLPTIVPGLVDLQVNGYAGLDVNDEALAADTVGELTARLAGAGVTTWLPTVVTTSEERITHALEQVERARATDPVVAAAVPGVHVEGPFISDRDGSRGVHDAAQIRPLDAGEVLRWCRHGRVAVVTVSPHADDAAEQIRRMRELGVVVSIGHTHASPEQVSAAVEAGARMATHLGNAIPLMLPRHPNVLWRQAADDRLMAGLIADGHHLPIDTLEVLLRAKGPRGAFLVSDLTAIGGLAPGTHRTSVGGVVTLDADNRLAFGDTGLLAGAAATLVDGLRTVVQRTSRGLAEALPLVTSNPARASAAARPGVGELRVGGPADLVLLDDAVRVIQVVQSGRAI
jgi:N-acetylglucosamine-6-phosphate deacetylase